MIFNKDTVIALKSAASEVLQSLGDTVDFDAIRERHSRLRTLWTDPRTISFRKEYGGAVDSMPDDAYRQTWRDTLHCIDSSFMGIKFVNDIRFRTRLLEEMHEAYTGLSRIERVHLDGINEHYAQRP